MKGRSTVTQLPQVLHDIKKKSVIKGEHVDMVYLDFEKAFDKVPRDVLIKKLQSFGIYGNLLKWLSSYLTSIQQRVAQGPYAPTPRGIAGVNLKNDIPRMHHAGVNVARG